MPTGAQPGTRKARQCPKWAHLPWMHKRARERAKRDQARARDGDLCWRCGHPMRFDGLPNCGKAATVEHVQPRAHGGTWALENLRLVHVGCNRHLGANTPDQKERMRINRDRSVATG